VVTCSITVAFEECPDDEMAGTVSLIKLANEVYVACDYTGMLILLNGLA